MKMIAGHARFSRHLFQRYPTIPAAVQIFPRDLHPAEEFFARGCLGRGDFGDLRRDLAVKRYEKLRDNEKILFEAAGLKLFLASFGQ
jgi:hypothetical protein